MKKIIVFLFLVLASTTSFSQSTITSQTKTDYLQKSKKQKKTATIILIAGPVLIFTPMLIHPKTAGDATMGLVYGTMMAGFLCLPASIGFFLASSSNHKKAMRLSFKNETAPQIQKSSFVYKSFPSVTLKISL